jgi:predicted short-subunit dehydrogenase-like oxidoreductase (DUF2520 family)
MGDSSAYKEIVIVGTGHAASVLGRLCAARGHRVVQVYGRRRNPAESLASELGAQPVWEPDQIRRTTDLCILALADAALTSAGTWMPHMDALVVHTAGSVSMEVLKPVSDRYGVLYPLQSLRKNQERLPEIPFLVQGSDRETEHQLRAFARSLGSDVHHAGEDDRRKLHLAAVFTSNFANHLFALAQDYCQKEGVEFRMLLPLLEESVARMNTEDPVNLQTGPALRGDDDTITTHLAMLEQYPEMKNLYALLTASIRKIHNS